MADEEIFTMNQWAAARMLVARLRAETAGEEFEFESIGMKWLGGDDPICATTEDGLEINHSDVVYAAMVLLWSTLVGEEEDLEEAEALLGRLGIVLAGCEPGS